jgi:curved DNA-binding protein
MDYKDYYKSLGVKKNASIDEIKKQYRKLARQFHPDVNTSDKGAAAKFAEISEAYEVLSDDEKRKKYDSVKTEWEQYQDSDKRSHFDWNKYASPPGGSPGQSSAGWEDLFGGENDTSEFFRNLFGRGSAGQSGPRSRYRGADLRAEITITLEEAYSGGVKIITVGGRPIRLNLKPGIWDRQTIKIKGKGAPGSHDTADGDLYLTFLLAPHPSYQLEGSDLSLNVPVNLYAALLGSTLEVATISGTFKLRIPPGTKNGTVFKLKGKGFPHYGKPGSHGDLYLKADVELPERLTAEEQTLFRTLAALRNETVEGVKK